MKIWKRITSLWITILLLALPLASAAQTPDLTQKGSVALHLSCQGKPLPGGSVTLYHVASLSDSLEYLPEPEFEGSGADLSGPLTAKLAEALAAYAEEEHIPGQTQAVGSGATAVFSGLKAGLYLFVQEEVRSGYLPFRPFLVSLPLQVGDTFVYGVDASPKIAPEPEPTEPTEPTKPNAPPGLPQTGQTNWPIPVLGVTGLVLVAAGTVLCFTGRRKRRAS